MNYTVLNKRLMQTELLINAAQSFTSSLSVEEIITEILARALQVIEAADAGALFLYDQEKQVLRAKACAGFEWEELSKVALRPGESMTGYTFQVEKAQIYEKEWNVDQGMVTIEAENKHFYDRSLKTIQQQYGGKLTLRSAMCAPLIIKGDCIGVVTIDNFSSNISFAEDDLRLLITLANQAAIALENARLYQEERNRRKQLEELNRVIQSQHDELYRIHQAHQTLMQQVLRGGDINDLALTIHKILDNPILIYDPLLRLIANLGEHNVKAEIPPFLTELQKMLYRWKPKRIFPSLQIPIPYPVMLIPIATSDQILGILVVLESNHEFNEEDGVLAEQCGIVLALDLLKREAVYETEQRLKGEFLEDLKTEKNIEILKERMKAMGLGSKGAYLFMVCHLSLNGSPTHVNTMFQQIHKTIEKNVLNRNARSLVISRFNQSVILLSWPEQKDDIQIIQQSRNLAQGVADTINRLYPQVQYSFGIGRVRRKFEDLLQSYEEAKQVMNFIRSQNTNFIIRDYSEMGAVRFILEQPKDELIHYVTELLHPLLQHPSQKKRELLNALDAFMIYGRSLKEAAAYLGIQPNTLTYRLKKVQEILGFYIDDYSGYFNLSFAWKILETYGLKGEILGDIDG